MSGVQVHNVWARRQQQQNLKGLSPSSTENSKSSQNASTKTSSGPVSVVNTADDEAWPQVNVNALKSKEKAKENNFQSPSSTTDENIVNLSPKKGDKTKPKWVPMNLEDSTEPSHLKNNHHSSSTSTSNVASPRHKSPVSLPLISNADTSAAATSSVLNTHKESTVDSPHYHAQTELAQQSSTSATALALPSSLEPDPSSRMAQPWSRSASPPREPSVIPPNEYAPYPQTAYPYHLQPYPPYDPASSYTYNPYAPSSSHPARYTYPSEAPPFFSGQSAIPLFQTSGAEPSVLGTAFGDVESSKDRRVPPFGVGCVEQKGKRKGQGVSSSEISTRRRRRKTSTFGVSSWKSSFGDEIIDLTLVGESHSLELEHDRTSHSRNRQRWVFIWNGKLVNMSRHHPTHHPPQQSYDPRYPYPYYHQPIHPYTLPFQPAPPSQYSSVYQHHVPYSHLPQHSHSHSLPPPHPQPLSVYPSYSIAQAPQPTYPYTQPNFEAEHVKETREDGSENGIPIPNPSTTTILVSASPPNVESDSVASNASSSSTNTNANLGVPSSHSSTTATSVQDESDSESKLPPLSALPTLNNLPTLGSLPTPMESRNKLSPDPQTPPRESPGPPNIKLNPTHDPFIPSSLMHNPPLSEQTRDRFRQEEDDSVFEVRYDRQLKPAVNGWTSDPPVPKDEETWNGHGYSSGGPMVREDYEHPNNVDDLRFRRGREFEFPRGGYRPNGDWRGGRPPRARGFGMGRGRGRGGFRGRGFGQSSGFVPPVRDAYEVAMNGMHGPPPPRYRHGRNGSYVPPNMEMPQYYPHQNHTSPSLTPPQGYSVSPYASHPTTSHPSPLVSQGSLSLHHTPPGQYHVPAEIPVQAPLMTWGGQHPWPTPLTPLANIPIVLDEVRYRLLGQLEYYLSEENMAKDMWLRRKMSLDGWIPLSVIAAFNRIKQLTDNLGLVREVLGYSEHVEVSDDYELEGVRVRMRDEGWKRFLLPPPVVVRLSSPPDKIPPAASIAKALNGVATADAGEKSSPPSVPHMNGDVPLPASTKPGSTPVGSSQQESDESEGEEEVDSEDEDDVVFVMGSDSGGGWSRAASGERRA
ncbi:hypothetical protein AAF712_003229 [Marasmius tenuissimus]|uniref:HTH La-type RNA-binding domain-containing protein n=1 Tax=Marasmius tenuissimus TaxID=585030 RepID=A0ABR3A8B9_9AGAR